MMGNMLAQMAGSARVQRVTMDSFASADLGKETKT